MFCFKLGVLICLVVVSFSAAAVSYTTKVNVCFTPQQYCRGKILRLIYSAKQSIKVQAYSFTSFKIANALVKMKEKGVDVQVLMDKSQFICKKYSMRGYLIRHGVPVWNDYQPRIAHNKILIIDNQIVETGSYNFTKAAQQYNSENIVVIRSHEIAHQFMQNWLKRRDQSRRMRTQHCTLAHNSQHFHQVNVQKLVKQLI